MKKQLLHGAALVSAIACSQTSPSSSQSRSVGPVTIANSEQLTLRSDALDQDFLVQIVLPPGYASSEQSYAVLYVVDPTVLIGHLASDTYILSIAQQIPASILVGIAYDLSNVPDGISSFQIRNRDLTPTFDPEFASENPSYAPGFEPGGAEEYLDFINDEVKPLIGMHYRVQDARETLVGYSFGGLFALYALFTAPDSFDNYVVASPAIWWDDRVIFGFEESLAQRAGDITNSVFLSVGESEEDFMVEDFRAIVERLEGREYDSLRLDTYVFEGENHASGIGAAMSRGVRSVLGAH